MVASTDWKILQKEKKPRSVVINNKPPCPSKSLHLSLYWCCCIMLFLFLVICNIKGTRMHLILIK